MKKIRVINFFITFASDTTLAHAVSMHGESLLEAFVLRRNCGWGLVLRHNIKAFT